MIGWMCALLAFAEDPETAPPPEPEAIEIPEAEDEAIGSALDDPAPVSFAEDEGLDALLGRWREGKRDVWGGSSFVRPTLSLLVYEDRHPVQLGISAGRRWWQLQGVPSMSVTVMGNADAALAGGRGSYALGLSALAGPWVHVVGLQMGPGLAVDRWDLGGPRRTLAAAAGIDLWTLIVLDAKLLHLFGGVAPRWLLSDRPGGGLRPLEALGDELGAKAGVAATLGSIRLSLDFSRRWTHIGRIDRYGVGVRFRLF